MQRSRLFVSALAALVLSGAATVTASAPFPTEPSSSAPAGADWTVTIGGDVDSPVSLTPADLAALTQVTQQATFESRDGSQTHTFGGPLLLDVLNLAAPGFDPDVKNDPPGHSIVVTAADGYVSTVAWGEIDPDFENKAVLLATSQDGAPLDTGPRLTAPGDIHGGRYVSDVVDIELVAAPAGAEPVVTTPSESTTAGGTAAALSGDLTVFAAASLTGAFTDIGHAFGAEYPDVAITFNFAASSDLVGQINEGAPADVFASADEANMTKLTDADGVQGDPATFATNTLEIIVEPGNPQDITGVADLADPDLIVVSAAPEVPIGAYAQQVFDSAGVDVQLDSLEENVKAIVEKVVGGEADAGLVYVTDVTAAGDGADGVEIPADINVTAEYPIAITADAPNPNAASAFEAFVLGEQGQAILAGYGFGAA